MARRTLAAYLGGIDTPHFDGFGPDAFRFLEELAAEQNREWFLSNKTRYEAQVRGPLAALVVDVSTELADRGVHLRGDPKSALFRINRDIRFSNDKRPYKTTAGAVLSRGGSKADPGILYIHVAATECFVAAGFYHPDPPLLASIRRTMAERPATWREVNDALAGVGLAFSREDRLVRTPKGFEHVSEEDVLDGLKQKSFVVRRTLEREAVGAASLVGRIADFAEDALPVFRLA